MNRFSGVIVTGACLLFAGGAGAASTAGSGETVTLDARVKTSVTSAAVARFDVRETTRAESDEARVDTLVPPGMMILIR